MGIFSAGLNLVRRHSRPASSVRLYLEPLEDRSLPSANTIASLSHDQVHVLQAQSQQQTATATIRLEVDQIVLGILQPFAPQLPQFKPLIASLTAAIPMQQATVQTLQNQTNLLNQLDDLQDQGILLTAQIQSAAALVPMLQRLGDMPAVNVLNNIIFSDQAAVQSLQPQIAAVEVQVSAFA